MTRDNLPDQGHGWRSLAAACCLLAALYAVSLTTGVADFDLRDLVDPGAGEGSLLILMASRIPRSTAIVLCGASMGVAAVIMQMLFRNRFIEPTTSGTVEAASLGLVVIAILAPGTMIFSKMLFAAGFSLVATYMFLRLVARIPAHTSLMIPLAGLMLGGVIEAVTVFLAYRFDLLQSVAAWTNGDFSRVLRGRYELLWIGFALTVAAYFFANRFTVAGLGRELTLNLGLNYAQIVAIGLVIVSLVTAASVVTVGVVPFLGLIVANLVSLFVGDNLKRTLPWIAISGACFLLACDIAGRLIRFPYEIPVGTVAGVLGSVIFLGLLLNRRSRHA